MSLTCCVVNIVLDVFGGVFFVRFFHSLIDFSLRKWVVQHFRVQLI